MNRIASLAWVGWLSCSSFLHPIRASASAPPVEAIPVEPAEAAAAVEPAAGVPALSAVHGCKDQPSDARYQVTVKPEADLADLVDWMTSVSCLKFMWSPDVRVRGKINIVSPGTVTLAEAHAAFYSALNTLGLTVEPAGAYLKIVETKDVAARALPIYGPSADVPDEDRFVTRLIVPERADLAQTVAFFDGLKTADGSVTSIGDVAVVTDTGRRIRQLLALWASAQKARTDAQQVFLYGVQHAEAEALATLVQSVWAQTHPGAAQPTSSHAHPGRNAAPDGRAKATPTAVVIAPEEQPLAIHHDPRTQTLVVIATPEQWASLRELIDALDRPTDGAAKTLHIIELKHADATEVEGVLTNVAGSASPGGKGPEGTTVAGEVNVTAHKATQTLVISASHSDFQALRQVVERIDRPRKQLYIEVYLLEVQANQGLETGAGGHLGSRTPGGGLGLLGSSPGGVSPLALATEKGAQTLLGSFTAAMMGPPIPGSSQLLGGLPFDLPAFGVILQALETREDVNVVATPHLSAAENEKASVEFGETVPMRKGEVTFSPQGGAQLLVEDKPVSLTLEVTPHINDDQTVTLDVLLEDNQLGAFEEDLAAYRTHKRRLDLKKVVAHPGHPVVLGGLVKERETVSTAQVPGLGSVPILGWLFKKRSKSREKITLLMVMVPHLIETPSDVRAVHARRMQERADFLQRYTAFKNRDLDPMVDYRKKGGLLSAINSALAVEQDELQALAAARAELERTRFEATVDVQPAAAK